MSRSLFWISARHNDFTHDDLADIDDEADDELGNVVARCRLAGKDERPRLHLFALLRGGLLDLHVSVDDRKDVESLPLVFVHSLDLARKDAVDVDEDAEFFLEDVGETALVVLLDDVPGLAEVDVLGHGQKVAQELRVGEPLVRAQRVGDQLGELGIALKHPATGSDAVGDIREKVATLELDKVAEDGGLEELAVEFGDTVDLEGADNGEVSHADVFGGPFLDDGHAAHAVHVVGPALGDLAQEFAGCEWRPGIEAH